MTTRIDYKTGEIITIEIGGLYTPFPVPAYQCLANAGQHKAQQVLSCLVSYLGKGSNWVWPSYKAISKRCGIHRSQIKASLDVLEAFGFIRVVRGNDGIKKRNNRYQICNSGYDVNKFSVLALDYLETSYMCKSCGNQISQGQTRKGPKGVIHLGCGGSCLPRKYKQVRNKSFNKLPTQELLK